MNSWNWVCYSSVLIHSSPRINKNTSNSQTEERAEFFTKFISVFNFHGNITIIFMLCCFSRVPPTTILAISHRNRKKVIYITLYGIRTLYTVEEKDQTTPISKLHPPKTALRPWSLQERKQNNEKFSISSFPGCLRHFSSLRWSENCEEGKMRSKKVVKKGKCEEKVKAEEKQFSYKQFFRHPSSSVILLLLPPPPLLTFFVLVRESGKKCTWQLVKGKVTIQGQWACVGVSFLGGWFERIK